MGAIRGGGGGAKQRLTELDRSHCQHMVLARSKQYGILRPSSKIINGNWKNRCCMWNIFPVTYVNSVLFGGVFRKLTSQMYAVLRRLITCTSDVEC